TSGDGRLWVQVHARGLTTRLSLLDARGRALVESDGRSPSDPDGQIDLHVTPGTYFLEVVRTGGAGDWVLTATFTPASPPAQLIPVGSSKYPFPGNDPLVVADFNGDGIPDLATVDGIHLGVGDGTFREPPIGLGLSAANADLYAMVAGDFNGDGKL